MQGAFSGKTGFTGNAGYCYVGALTREDRTYIVALLACGWPNNRTYKWSDSKKLMQYGIENYKKADLREIQINLEEIGTVLVENGQGSRIGESTYTKVELGEVTGYEELLIAKEEEVKVSYQVKQKLQAPVLRQTCIGRVIITINDEIFREYEVLTKDEVKEIDFWWCVRMVVAIFQSGI